MSFSSDLRTYAQKTGLGLDSFVRRVVIQLGQSVVERSPVGNPKLWQSPPPAGYVGGRFRANWQYGFGAAPNGALPDVDASGRKSMERIQNGALSSPAIGIHYIVNNLPYAQRLEDGWSTQAPAGMVGLAVTEFRRIVREEASRL